MKAIEAPNLEVEIVRNTRELAYRESKGIGELSVQLWWIEGTNEVGLDVHDKGVNVSFCVPPEKALEAFYSPWGYMPPHLKPIHIVKSL